MKKSFLKNSMFVALLAAGLGLASCGSNKTEGDATATDTISSTETEITTDTVTTVTDTVTPPVNDTVAP